jgi:hypothetical protein
VSEIRHRELNAQDIISALVRNYDLAVDSGLGVRNEGVGVDTVGFVGFVVLETFFELREPMLVSNADALCSSCF